METKVSGCYENLAPVVFISCRCAVAKPELIAKIIKSLSIDQEVALTAHHNRTQAKRTKVSTVVEENVAFLCINYALSDIFWMKKAREDAEGIANALKESLSIIDTPP